MLRSYAYGFISAVVAVVLVGAILFGEGRKEQPALLWGNQAYTSRDDFDGYLKSRSLSYKAWAARHPGAAPWEPGEFTIGSFTWRASVETREAWVIRLPLAALALALVSMAALLGLRRLRPTISGHPLAFGSAILTVGVAAAVWLAI